MYAHKWQGKINTVQMGGVNFLFYNFFDEI